jgi:asparagine synthase (glutamine-hydrolysing)
MCGIAGIYRAGEESASRSDEVVVAGILSRSSYRGPDHQAVARVDSRTVLGHTRLAIVDPNPRSNQPMESVTGRAWMVYNGELYNCDDLRNELISEGWSFRTLSDTEVVMHALEAWGLSALNRFNGIFALAYYDRRERQLLLATDRYGVKPLYYVARSNAIHFSSDYGALLRCQPRGLSLDADGVGSFAAMRYVPGDRTIVSGVRKISAAHALVWGLEGECKTKRYWRLAYSPDRFDEGRLYERIREDLREGTRRQLIGEAPFGVLLSGGLDSAAILACTAMQSREPVRAFSARFDTDQRRNAPAHGGRIPVIHDYSDESNYAQLVSDMYGAELTVIDISMEDLESSFDDMVRRMGEPMASIDAIGHYCLAQKIDSDVKFLLSGVGADELFGGYAELYFGAQGELLSKSLSSIDYLRIIGSPDRLDLGFIEVLQPHLRSLDYATSVISRALDGNFRDSERLNETLQVFIEAADLPFWELKQADAMYMAASKEVRVPFLDNDVFDLSWRLESRWKWRDGKEKFALRKALRPWLPETLVERKKFPSLGTPSRFYARPWFRARVDQLMNRNTIWIPELLSKYCNGVEGRAPDLDVLYRFVVLDQWLREFVDG